MPAKKVAATRAHGIPPLLELLRAGTAANQKKNAAGAPAKPARDEENKAAIAGDGLQPLIDFLRGSMAAEKKENATVAL